MSENNNNNKFIIKQDSYQISESYVVFCIEMYRMLVSCLLLIFIPKKCIDHTCSYTENMANYYEAYSRNYTEQEYESDLEKIKRMSEFLKRL